jgi:hypothetical protein
MSKRALITTINNRINLEEKNIRSVDIVNLEKYLLDIEKFNEVSFLSKKTSKEYSIDNYIDIYNIKNINYATDLFIYNNNCNFFGGKVSSDVIKTIKLINEFEGNLYYLITDPRINITNYAKIIYDRSSEGKLGILGNETLTIDDVKKFTSQIEKMKAIWCGRDYQKFIDSLNDKEIKYIINNFFVF